MSVAAAGRRFLVPTTVLLGTLSLAAVVGTGTLPVGRVPNAVIAIPAAVSAVIGLLMTLKRLGFGLALLPVVAATVPFSVGTGTQSSLVAALLLSAFLLGIWAVRAVLLQDVGLANSPVNGPLFAFVVAWVLSYAYGNATLPPLVIAWASFPVVQVGQLAIVFSSVGVLLLAASVGRDLRWIQLATWSFLGVGLVGALVYLTRLDSVVSFLSMGGLFTLWVVALAYGQALFNQRLRWWARLGLLGLVLAWVYIRAISQTTWVSGWLPIMVALGFMTLRRSKPAFGLLMLAALTVLALRFDTFYQAVFVPELDESGYTRMDNWLQAWDLLRQHPLLGTGPAGYAAYYMSLYAGSGASMSTHSNYVDIAAQTGLVGAAIFAWFLVSLLMSGWRATKRWRSNFAGGYAQGAYGGLIGAIVGMGLGDWVIPFAYNQTIVGFRYSVHSWVFLGFLVALATLQPHPNER